MTLYDNVSNVITVIDYSVDSPSVGAEALMLSRPGASRPGTKSTSVVSSLSRNCNETFFKSETFKLLLKRT